MVQFTRFGELEPCHGGGELVRSRAGNGRGDLRRISRRDLGRALALEQRMTAFEGVEEMLPHGGILGEGKLAFAGL